MFVLFGIVCYLNCTEYHFAEDIIHYNNDLFWLNKLDYYVGVTNVGVTNVGVTNVGVTNVGVTNVGVTNVGVTNARSPSEYRKNGESGRDMYYRWMEEITVDYDMGFGAGIAQ